MSPVHFVPAVISSPTPCWGKEPGSRILPGSECSNHFSWSPTPVGSNLNPHEPANERLSDAFDCAGKAPTQNSRPTSRRLRVMVIIVSRMLPKKVAQTDDLDQGFAAVREG